MTTGLFGANGMLGRALASELDSRGITYVPIVRSTNYQDLPNFNLLINAAGNSKKYLADKKPVEDFENNVTSLVKLLHSAQCRKARLVHISSSEVYGPMDPSKPLVSENAPLNPDTNYGFSKKVAEEIVQNYAEQWLIFRLGGQYGHGMTKGPIFDILNDKLLRLTPNSTLQLMNIKETATHVLNIVKSTEGNQVFNLANPEILQVSEIATLLRKSATFDNELVKYSSHLSVAKVSELVTIKDQSSELVAFKSVFSPEI